MKTIKIGSRWDCGAWGRIQVTAVKSNGRVEGTVVKGAPPGGNNTQPGDELSLLRRDFESGAYIERSKRKRRRKLVVDIQPSFCQPPDNIPTGVNADLIEFLRRENVLVSGVAEFPPSLDLLWPNHVEK